MITLTVPCHTDIFSTPEEDELLLKNIKDFFNLPYPDALKVTLSSSALNKIKYYYGFMKENNIVEMQFYIFAKNKKEIDSFYPMKNDIVFDSNEYLDMGDVFFKTFDTNGVYVSLNQGVHIITFFFLYTNSWTEHSFKFSTGIENLSL